METKKRFWIYLETVIAWVGDFFKDQKNSSSSKRLALFVYMYLFYRIVNTSLQISLTNLEKVDVNVLASVVLVILFLIGAITSEFFKNIIKKE